MMRPKRSDGLPPCGSVGKSRDRSTTDVRVRGSKPLLVLRLSDKWALLAGAPACKSSHCQPGPDELSYG